MSRKSQAGEDRAALPRTSPQLLAACAQALRAVRRQHPDATTIAVTSVAHGEGRSTIAAGIAIADVRSLGRRAVLVDLDVDNWHTDGPAGEGGLPARVWPLIEWINDDLGVLGLQSLVQRDSMTRSQVGAVASELIEHEVDVLADLSCLPPVGGADRFAPLFDVVVLVVRAGVTSEEEVRRAALTLAEPPMVLLNRKASAVPRWLRMGGQP